MTKNIRPVPKSENKRIKGKTYEIIFTTSLESVAKKHLEDFGKD